MKILTLAFYIVVGGYVISEITSFTDPPLQVAFSGLTSEEINQDIPSLSVASGEVSVIGEPPSFEVMVIEEKAGIRVMTF